MRRSILAALLSALVAATGHTQAGPGKLRVAGDPVPLLLAKPVSPPPADAWVAVVKFAGQPVAGADVFAIDRAAVDARAEDVAKYRAAEPDPLRRAEQLAVWFGTRAQTDAQGHARVPRSADLTLFVRAGNRVTQRRVQDWDGAEIALKLVQQAEVVAEVVDQQARPVADMELQLGRWLQFDPQRADSGIFSRVPNPAQRPGRTAADGRVRMRLEGSALRTQPLASFGDAPLELAAAVVGKPGAYRAKLQLAAEGSYVPVRIVVPPTGAVRVLLYDERERPLQRVESTSLVVLSDGQRPALDLSIDLSRELTDGKTFRHVELGQRLRATAKVRGIDGPLTVDAAGPTIPGELVVIPLRMQAADPIVRCTVVGLDGQPVTESRLWLVRPMDGQFSTRPDITALRVAADGAVQFTVPRSWLATSTARAVLLVCRGTQAQATDYRGTAQLTLPADSSGVVELGTVRLVADPPLVRGKVLDAAGQPVAGLALRAPSTQVAHDELPVLRKTDFDHRIVTAADGSFELRESSPRERIPVRLELTAKAPGESVIVSGAEIAAGTMDAIVRVSSPASLTLELPGIAPQTEVELCLRSGAESRASAHLKADAQGRFVWRNLPSGTFDLVVGGARATSALLTDLRLEAGAACADPRLVLGDWRARWVAAAISVRATDGQPLDGNVMATIHSEHAGTWGRNIPEGRAQWLVPRDAKVTVRHSASLTVTVAAAEKLEVALQARPEVVITLPKKLRLPDGVRVSLASIGTDPATSSAWNLAQRVVLRPDAVGELECAISVHDDRRPLMFVLAGVGGPGPVWTGKVSVRAGEVTEFVLPIDASVVAEVEAALQDAQQRRR